MIVTFTNEYARETIASYGNTKYGKYLQTVWYELTVVELKAYIGTILASGIVQLKSWKEYWSEDPLTRQPAFTNSFTYIRWKMISRFLNFGNPDKHNKSRLGKIWNIYPFRGTANTENFTPRFLTFRSTANSELRKVKNVKSVIPSSLQNGGL